MRAWWRLSQSTDGSGSGDGGGAGAGGSGSGQQGGGSGDGAGAGDGKPAGGLMSGGAGQSGAGAGDQGDGAGAGGAGAGGKPGEGAGGEPGPWLWADEVPGTGTAPPWYKADKYKSVAEQARSAVELEKKLGPAAELIGAPEGDYTLPAPPDGVKGAFDPEDPMLKAFQAEAKAMGLSQKAFERVLGSVASAIAQEEAAEAASIADAIAALGNNASQRITAVQNYVTTTLGAEAFAALDAAIGTDVKAYQALEQLVARASGDAQLSGLPGKSGPGFNRQDVEAEQFKVFPEGHNLAGKRMYDHDKAHRAKVDAMWKELFPGDNRQEVG